MITKLKDVYAFLVFCFLFCVFFLILLQPFDGVILVTAF